MVFLQSTKKGFIRILLLYNTLLIFSASPLSANPACYEEKNPVPHKICLHEGAANQSLTVLYFHGLGGNETHWGSEGHFSRELLSQLESWGIPKPQVISVSFGPAWFLVSKNSAPESGLQEALFQRILPQAEEKLPLRPSSYWFIGESMGGFNSYYSGIHERLVSAPVTHVVSLCPAMVEMSPYDSVKNQERIRKSIGMRQDRFISYLAISRRFIGTHFEWLRENPFQKTKDIIIPFATKFHLSCGDADEWGFHAGSYKINQLLSATHTYTEWKTYPGKKHCAIEVNDIAKFLRD